MSNFKDKNPELELAWLRGNEKDFSLLYDRYKHVLYGIALSYLKDTDSSDDLIQELFLTLWNKRQDLEIQNMKAYLFQMTRNRCLDYLKAQKHIEDIAEAEDLSHEQTPQQELEFKETGKRLQNLIQNLSPQCRTVFLLVRFENLKYKEVAGLLSISEKTVENHMGRALKALRLGMSNQDSPPLPFLLYALFIMDWGAEQLAHA